MQNHELNPVILMEAALDPSQDLKTRRLRASRLLAGDRLMLNPGDQVLTNGDPHIFVVEFQMFSVVHSVIATKSGMKMRVNLMDGNGRILGWIMIWKSRMVTVGTSRAELFHYSGLPDCVTSIDSTFLPDIGRAWHVYHEDQKIGQIWSHETGSWHCWAIRDSNFKALKNIDACLIYIAGIYKGRLRQDNSSRAALLSILGD